MRSFFTISPTKKIVLVTGPPGSGRDEYLREALPQLQQRAEVGYHHVFEYMQRAARRFSVPNLQRATVFEISKSTLEAIRDQAFADVERNIRTSNNAIEIVSTPATFRVVPSGDYLTGRVEGLTRSHMEKIKPTYIVVFIDDLLSVRERMTTEPLRTRMNLSLSQLAEWRQSALEIVRRYCEETGTGWIIFAKEHPATTFVDLLLGEKPLVYLSYHITGQQEHSDVERFMNTLSPNFVVIDPLAIRDWDIVTAYDDALRSSVTGLIDVDVQFRSGTRTFQGIPLQEIEEAIDSIRSQIVERDFLLIASVHATVVYHKDEKPSYGVMAEVIFSRTQVNRPVYVLYPFPTRPTPSLSSMQSVKTQYEEAYPLKNSKGIWPKN